MKTISLFWLVAIVVCSDIVAPGADSANGTSGTVDKSIIAPPASSANITTTTDADAKKTEPIDLFTTRHIIGSILMMILIILSNAGGLSGAGSNIPLMLIFFDMGMTRAVPISAFVAVCATTFRFILNYS